MGYIYLRGEVYWIQYSRKGKRYRESTGKTKKSEAVALLAIREGHLAQGKPAQIDFEKVTFEELVELVKQDYKHNDLKTPERLELSIKHLSGYFEGYMAVAITTDKIGNYIDNRMAQGYARSTINKELAALHRMYSLGAKHNPPKVDRIPCILALKESNTRHGFFEHGDFLKLRENMPEALRGMLTFAYKFGWRLGEIQNLTWDRVDLKNGVLRLEAGETKNDAPREIYLDEEMIAIFQAQYEAMKTRGKILPYIFTNEKGDAQLKQFRKRWASACKAAKIGKRLFHDFRRTAIRNMVRAGIPEKVAMSISGHKTRSVFERYNIVDGRDLKEAAQKIADYQDRQAAAGSGEVVSFPEKGQPQ